MTRDEENVLRAKLYELTGQANTIHHLIASNVIDLDDLFVRLGAIKDLAGICRQDIARARQDPEKETL